MADDSSPSSSEDEEHNAALRSVAIDSNAVLQFATPSIATSNRKFRSSKSLNKSAGKAYENDDEDGTAGLKFYQIRVQDLLHKHLDNFFEASLGTVAAEPKDASEVDDRRADDETYDGDTRLFSNAPVGVVLKRSSLSKESHTKVRRLPPRYDSSDEDSAEHLARFQAAAIDGYTIKAQAEKAQAKASGIFLAAEAAAQKAEKAEQEQVGRLRRERGEEWLPSIAKEMMKDVRADTQRRKAMTSEGKIGVVVNYRI